MKWNFDEIIGREGTSCVKYDLRKEIFGTGDVIPMWVADMDFRTPDFIIDDLRKRLEHELCGYSFRPSGYYSSIISWMARRHHWNIEREWVCFSPGVVPALNFCTLAFTQPGDKIIVQPPVYFPFFSAIEAHGRSIVYNNLKETGARWEMDIDSLITSIDDRTKMIFISNPHNPVGRAWTADELTRLSEVCLRKSILMISDEIHSDLVLPGSRHIPLASLSGEAASRTVTLVAPSKTFNLAGLSTSSVIISDPGLRKAFRAVTENMHITNGNLFGTIASMSAYNNGDQWLEELLVYLDANIEFTIDYFQNLIPEIVPVRPEATYMIWLDCRKLGMSSKELQNFFVKSAGVGMNEGAQFGPGGEGFMRINVAAPLSVVRKSMEQIEKAVSALR